MRIRSKTLLKYGILIVVMSVIAVESPIMDYDRTAEAKKKRKRVLNLASVKVVDLSHIMHENLPVFPGGQPFKPETTAGYDEGYYARKFECGEHIGTHVDAPAHFAPGKRFIHELKPTELLAPLVVIDVEAQVRENSDYLLQVEDIRNWEREHGAIPARAFVALKTGWERRWDSEESYLNMDDSGVMHFPGFSLESVKYLDKKGVASIGIDTLSLDFGGSKDFAVHHYFLGKDKYMVENLVSLASVPAKGAYVVIAPVKLQNGSGAPARILALVP